MKTKTILKTLAVALLMPAMLLTTACSSDDDFANDGKTASTQAIANKGYALPVTVNVTRQGDGTRATFNESTRKLEFSAGDKLFVRGTADDITYEFAGTLDYVSEGTFSGTIYINDEWPSTFEELLAAVTEDDEVTATLLPAGYGSTGFLSINNNSTPDDATDDYVSTNYAKAFALTKKEAVEQFSYEAAYSYSSGFTLEPDNAIINFTISGLAANTEVAVSFHDIQDNTSGSVTTDASGVATFAVGMPGYSDLLYYSLTVAGNPIPLVNSSKTLEAGMIYNISRSMPVIWNSSKVAGINIYIGDPEENSFESDGITVAAFGENSANFVNSNMSVASSFDYFTFTSTVGNIKKIEINYTGDVYGYEEEPPVGWSLVDGTFTWSGTPTTSVTLPASGFSAIEGITSIVFTLE